MFAAVSGTLSAKVSVLKAVRGNVPARFVAQLVPTMSTKTKKTSRNSRKSLKNAKFYLLNRCLLCGNSTS